MIKIVIIIVLKLNLKVDLGQSQGHWSRPRSPVGLTRVIIKIKKVIIIILNSIQELTRGKTRVTSGVDR
jgi:hypothetical protein